MAEDDNKQLRELFENISFNNETRAHHINIAVKTGEEGINLINEQVHKVNEIMSSLIESDKYKKALNAKEVNSEDANKKDDPLDPLRIADKLNGYLDRLGGLVTRSEEITGQIIDSIKNNSEDDFVKSRLDHGKLTDDLFKIATGSEFYSLKVGTIMKEEEEARMALKDNQSAEEKTTLNLGGDFVVKPEKTSNFVKVPDTVFARALVESLSKDNIAINPSFDLYKRLENILDVKSLKGSKGVKIDKIGPEFRKLMKNAKPSIDENGETEIDRYYEEFCKVDPSTITLSQEEINAVEYDTDGSLLTPEKKAERKAEEETEKKRLAFDQQIADFFKDGFSIETKNGQTIDIHKLKDGKMTIEFTGKNKKFDSESAEAMIALSAASGWRAIEINGNPKEKDLLWVEIEKRNLIEKLEFERAKAAGEISENEAYIPLTCSNKDFFPGAKAQAQAEEAKKHILEAFKEHVSNEQTQKASTKTPAATTTAPKP